MRNAKAKNLKTLASDVAKARKQNLDSYQYRYVSISKPAIESEIRTCISFLPVNWQRSANDLNDICITTDIVLMLIERDIRKFVARRPGIDAVTEDIFQDCWVCVTTDTGWSGPVVMKATERNALELAIYRIVDKTTQRYFRRLRNEKEATNTLHSPDGETNSRYEAIDMVKTEASDEEVDELARVFKKSNINKCEGKFLLDYERKKQSKTAAERKKKCRLIERIRVAMLMSLALALVMSVKCYRDNTSPDQVAKQAIATETVSVVEWQSCKSSVALKSCRPATMQIVKSCNDTTIGVFA